MDRMPHLSRRRTILVAVLVVVVALCRYASWVRFSEPRYNGKPVSYWFENYCYAEHRAMEAVRSTNRQSADLAFARLNSAHAALLAVGTNAAPSLLKRVAYDSFGSKSAYGRAYAKLPTVLRRGLPDPARRDRDRLQAIEVLAAMKARGEPAVSVVLDYILRQPVTATDAILFLMQLQPKPDQVERLLTDTMQKGGYEEVKFVIESFRLRSPVVGRCAGEFLDKKGLADMWGFQTLREIGDGALPAMPILLRLLNSTNAELRYQTAWTLEAIGPSAAEALPALQACATASSSMVQSAAKRAIEAITVTNSATLRP